MKGYRFLHSRNSRFAFTLIELLVVIAIITILTVVVILTLNPAELLRQSRDSNRVSDMDTLTRALGIYSEDVSAGNMGSSSIVYVSIPDPIATSTAGDQCQGIGLPTLPATYTYHCASVSTDRNVDGTGWIPTNLKSISSGAPIGSLPVDPTNNSSSRLYYTYATNGTTYEVTTGMESQKYKVGGSNDVITSDGGTKASVYEKGTNLALEPLDYGDTSLVGLWSFEEGSSSIAYDYSGNNVTGTWNGTPTGTAGYYSTGKIGNWAGAFDGSTDYISFSSTLNGITNAAGPLTIAAWVNIPNCANNFPMIMSFGFSLELRMNASTCKPELTGAVSPSAISTSTWHHLVGVVSGGANAIYVDGIQKATGTSGGVISSFSIGNRVIGGYYFPGLIDDVRIYNRALSAAEIQSLYNGGK